MYERAIVVLSGGQDSTTCLYWAKQNYNEVHAVTFHYGQRHAIEVEAAMIIARMADVKSHEVIAIKALLKGLSPLVNPSVEVGTYKSTADLPGGVEPTFIPARNPLFLTIAANRAALLDAQVLVTGVCEIDYGGYFDCRSNFLQAMEKMLSEALYGEPHSFKIMAPLLHRTKAESVALAKSLPGCLDAMAYSHTCYQGSFPPCRTCHACLLRQKGFDEAGIPDPLITRVEI